MRDSSPSPATDNPATNVAMVSAEESTSHRNNGAVASTDGSQAFLIVHDKTPEMRVLYVSSSVRHIVKYEPLEVIGQPSLGFVTQATLDFYKSTLTKARQDEVVVSHLRVPDRDGNPVYLRVIHFNCDNMGFNVSMTRPDVGGSGMEDKYLGSLYRLSKRHAVRDTIHGCLVLENQVVGLNSLMGPQVLFASRSFGKMIGVDTSDIQGSSFLSLVAPEDMVRASAFLERVASNMDVIVERLRMRVEQHDAKEAEVMAAGSDEGTILLCQMEKCGNVVDSSGCLSLEELISSDPETSDVASDWHRCLRG